LSANYQLQESTFGPRKVLGDTLRKNPNNMLVSKPGRSSTQTFLDKALEGRFAIVAVMIIKQKRIAISHYKTPVNEHF
jgi:hypothetical protein